MTLSKNRPSALVLLFSLLALGTAWAGVAELQTEADRLLVDYSALETDIENCVDGDCAEALDILDRQDQLDAELADLELDRDALGQCSTCGELDAALSDLDDASLRSGTETGQWQELD